ncbi:MAG TPA: hypothetical protein VJ946_05615, partial [Bacteroidales bacterium]|nr:hypothetical protein [Bacteroidales bacterium]
MSYSDNLALSIDKSRLCSSKSTFASGSSSKASRFTGRRLSLSVKSDVIPGKRTMVLRTDVIPNLHEWLRSHMDMLDALVFDIDGVLLVNGKAAPGSHEVLDMLRKNRMPFFLLTNDGDHSTKEKADILNAADLQIHFTEIVS